MEELHTSSKLIMLICYQATRRVENMRKKILLSVLVPQGSYHYSFLAL